MDFKNNKPIYKQIIDYCFGNIMSGEWAVDGRVPSIKELSVELAVNNRTVIKAYEYMQMKEIIYVKRGLGYFVSPDARDIIVEERRDEFFQCNALGCAGSDFFVHHNLGEVEVGSERVYRHGGSAYFAFA